MDSIGGLQRFWSMRHGRANADGMTILEVVFALAVFVLFAGVMAAISQQLLAYLGSDQALALDENEQAPSPALVSWKLADRLHWLAQILDQPAIPNAALPLGLSQCSANPLTKLPVGMVANSSFALDADAADSEFQLGSRYEICLIGPYNNSSENLKQQLFVLVAKPTSAYRTSPLLPVVRHVFCRPRPLCSRSQ